MELAQNSLELVQPNPRDRPRNAARAEGSAFTSPSSECAACGGAGWIRVEAGKSTGYRKCECRSAQVIRERLSEIPERFREATFESYFPRTPSQERVHRVIKENPEGSYFLHGPYDSGKTHLLYAQYRRLALAGIPCSARTTVELLNEIQRMEFDHDFLSPAFAQVRTRGRYHLFWDDADKIKLTDFRAQALHELIDTIYRKCLNLTITSNYSLKELGDLERLPPSVIRRIDGMCKVLEIPGAADGNTR